MSRRIPDDITAGAQAFVASLAGPRDDVAPVGVTGNLAEQMPTVAPDTIAVQEVRENLTSIGKPCAGAIKMRWTVRALLLILIISSDLRAGADLPTVFSNMVRFLLGEPGEQLARDIVAKVFPLPTWESLRDSRLRLDLFSQLFERHDFLQFYFLRYLLIDGTSLLGRQFLLVREDRIRCPKAAQYDATIRAAVDYQMAFETRICPLPTSGFGHCSCTKKHNSCRTFLHERVRKR